MPLNPPDRASFEFLKTLAKERLSTLRATNPAARLADAQLAVARDYGFPSWRALKKEVDHRRAPHVAGFISACTAGDVDGLEAILEKDPVEAGADVHGAGEVHQSGVIGWAAREGNEAVVDLLVAHGARHHMFSAMAPGDHALTERLVEEDPDCLSARRSRYECGQTPLPRGGGGDSSRFQGTSRGCSSVPCDTFCRGCTAGDIRRSSGRGPRASRRAARMPE
jgi:hypothetical protein